MENNLSKTSIFTADKVFISGEFQPNQYMFVKDDTIVKITNEPPQCCDDVVDFGSAAIFPGAVNTHTHSFQSLLRGCVDGKPLEKWLPIVYAVIQTFGEDESYLGAAISFGEMLRAGTTSVADHFYLNGRGNDNIRAAVNAAKDLGIRLVMGRVFMDASWGGDATIESVDTAIGRYRELQSEFKDELSVTICPAAHSIYGSSQPLIKAAYAMANEYDTRWYMHLADSESSANKIADQYGERSAKLLDRWGVLNERFVGVHSLYLSQEEIELLGCRNTWVSYNPACNMKNGGLILDLPKYRKNGIRVGVGTDGAPSNNALNIFRESRLISLVQKIHARNPLAITTDQLVNLITANGAQLLGLPVGKLDVGYKADFVVLDTLDFTLQPTKALKSNIIYAMSERAIKHVFVGGRQVVKEGKLVQVDERDLLERFSKQSESTLISAK